MGYRLLEIVLLGQLSRYLPQLAFMGQSQLQFRVGPVYGLPYRCGSMTRTRVPTGISFFLSFFLSFWDVGVGVGGVSAGINQESLLLTY